MGAFRSGNYKRLYNVTKRLYNVTKRLYNVTKRLYNVTKLYLTFVASGLHGLA